MTDIVDKMGETNINCIACVITVCDYSDLLPAGGANSFFNLENGTGCVAELS